MTWGGGGSIIRICVLPYTIFVLLLLIPQKYTLKLPHRPLGYDAT
jgi:hypothetical protein